MDNIVPFAMKARRFDVETRHLLLGNLSPWQVATSVQSAGNRQSLGGGGCGNQPYYRLVVPERFAPPVRANEREEPVLHFVPLAGSRREMAHGDRKPRLVGQALQLQFPKPQPVAVAATAIGGDQQLARLRIESLALMAPPSSNRHHRKGGRVMIGTHVDKARVLAQIVDAVGVGAWHRRTGKVVTLNVRGRTL